MARFDAFAEAYSFWIETVNPRQYEALLGDFLPVRLSHALDAGCGPGQLSFFLARYATHVTGVDISRSMIELAEATRRAAGLAQPQFVVADLERPPFPEQSFDLVASDCVLHDTPLDVTIPALRRLVRPGGRLLIRDLVTQRPRLSGSRVWWMANALRQAPSYTARFGPATARRLIAFEASPAWAWHRTQGLRHTPASFKQVYGHHLPGCRFVYEGWAMSALWEAPQD